MKRILLHNWKIKLTCLVLASAVWYVVRQNLDTTPVGLRWQPMDAPQR